MAQGRADDILKPVPNPPTHTEVIDNLKEDLSNWMQLCIKEESQIENLEGEIVVERDLAYDAPEVLSEESFGEAAYEKVAPYFVSAKTFLKHILDKNKDDTQEVKKHLHELLEMDHKTFKQLSADNQRKYLLDIAVISYAILQDLRILASKYMVEIDLCLSTKLTSDIMLEMVVNGATVILLDMALYHPDHAKDFAQYRQELYMSISNVDMSIHEFFTLMHAHVAAAMQFIKEYKPDLKRDSEEKEKKAQAGVLTKAIKLTALPPPVVEEAPATAAVAAPAEPVEPTASAPKKGGGICALL